MAPFSEKINFYAPTNVVGDLKSAAPQRPGILYQGLSKKFKAVGAENQESKTLGCKIVMFIRTFVGAKHPFRKNCGCSCTHCIHTYAIPARLYLYNHDVFKNQTKLKKELFLRADTKSAKTLWSLKGYEISRVNMPPLEQ